MGGDRKIVCMACDWNGTEEQLLAGKNPFKPTETIYGCPHCAAIEQFHGACDESGCWEPDTIGMPIPGGYRRTCRKHVPAGAMP